MAREKVYLFDHSPHLRGEWDYEKNTLDPDNITFSSSRYANWKCSVGHVWSTKVGTRTREKRPTGCPECFGRPSIVSGVNDLNTLYPHLANQLVHPTEAIGLAPYSNRKLEWVCAADHVWKQSANVRVGQNSGCPYCSNQKVLAGYNDLGTTHPELADELIDPTTARTEITSGSGKKVLWKCSLDHKYTRSVYRRTQGYGCPFCCNREVLKGYNDLSTFSPSLALELSDPSVCADEILFGSNQRVEWTCSLGHKWKTKVFERSKNNTGCPVCSGNVILAGFNDLKSSRPDLMVYWDDLEVDPSTIGVFSHKKVKWLCENGHKHIQAVSHKSNGRGCAKCATKHTSRSEGVMRRAIGERFDLLSDDHTYRLDIPFGRSKSMQVDSLFLSGHLKVVCEYDGWYFHKDRLDKDVQKTNILLNEGYIVIRLRECSTYRLPELPIISNNFLQIEVDYSETGENILSAITYMEKWIKEND